MRQRWILHPVTKELVPAEEYVRPNMGTRSNLSAPMTITDTMEPVRSMLDGKYYDSKAALRSTYRAAGVTEVGNDPSILDPKPRPKPKADKAAIKAAVRTAASRVGLGA